MNDNFFDMESNTFGDLNDEMETDFDLGSSDADFSGLSDDEPKLTGEMETPAEKLQQSKTETVGEANAKLKPIPTKQAPAVNEETEDEPYIANPFEAAMQKAEDDQAKNNAESLFSKLPVFEYGGASEEIKNADISFEQLRIEKSSDFPELEDGKKVSWNVEYGSIKKAVTNTKDTIIGKLKSEIETSAEFLTALKKAKEKALLAS